MLYFCYGKETMFKAFIGIVLVINMLLLATLTAVVLYAAVHVSRESKTVTDKVNAFNQEFSGINTNLQNISSRLQTASQAANLP